MRVRRFQLLATALYFSALEEGYEHGRICFYYQSPLGAAQTNLDSEQKYKLQSVSTAVARSKYAAGL